MRSAVAVPAVAGALALASGAQQVFVVDQAGGPGVYADVQAALDAGAGDGDVVLVREGSYGAFHIEGQGVSIVADAGATPTFSAAPFAVDAFRISGLAAGDAVVLRGLELVMVTTIDPPIALAVVGAGGTVWFEDCALLDGWPSLLVDPGGKAVLERCVLRGIDGVYQAPWWVWSPGIGLDVAGEAVLHGCSAAGGRGYDSHFTGTSVGPPAQGGDAARVFGAGVLSAQDTSFQGGQGGGGFLLFDCTPPATGGAGLHLAAGAPLARLFGNALVGGPPGEPASGCPPGSAGPGVLQEAGTVEDLLGPAPGLFAGAVAREGETLLGTVTGEPGALAFLALAPSPSALYLPSLLGTLLVAPQTVLALGAIPPGGSLALAAPVGEIGAGVSALQLTLQAAACGSGGCALGAGSHAVLLDAAF